MIIMDIKVGRNWGLFAAGIALVIIGFVLLMVPGLTLVSIAVIAGCMFLAAGIVLSLIHISEPTRP